MHSNRNMPWWAVSSLFWIRTAGTEDLKVQERALKAVPQLCESIDYAEVQGVLFPRVAVRIILLHTSAYALRKWYSIVTSTACIHEDTHIICKSGYPYHFPHDGEDPWPGLLLYHLWYSPTAKFHPQSSLTQKLVPLLSKIRTKEPAVIVSATCMAFTPEQPQLYWMDFTDGDFDCSRGHGIQSGSRSSRHSNPSTTLVLIYWPT